MPKAHAIALAIALGSSLASAVARADQFLLTDVAYTHSTSTTKDSHYRVVPLAGTPPNWVSPVDYSKGSAYVRVEVKTKPPGAAPTRFQICFEGSPAYACTAQSPVYTTAGVQEWSTPFSAFYQGDGVGVDWSKGVAKVALILKDDKNGKPAPENVDAGVVALYMPTDLHVIVGIASAGATFKLPPDAGAQDAGSGRPSAADAGASDASAPSVSDAKVAADAEANADAASQKPGADSTSDAAHLDAEVRPGAGQNADGASGGADVSEIGPDDDSSKGGCSLASSPRSGSLWNLAWLSALALWPRGRARTRRF